MTNTAKKENTVVKFAPEGFNCLLGMVKYAGIFETAEQAIKDNKPFNTINLHKKDIEHFFNYVKEAQFDLFDFMAELNKLLFYVIADKQNDNWGIDTSKICGFMAGLCEVGRYLNANTNTFDASNTYSVDEVI